MGYFGWKPYVPVAERRAKAEKAVAKANKAGASTSPIAPYRGAVAKTFWGKSWCENLENYSDYSNRLPRGRTYVRNGSVIDLKVGIGTVRAQVMGSSLYKVEANIAEVSEKHWQAISADCAGSIDTLVELLQGKLSKAVMERICKPGSGLFPAPKEIKFSCSCPDGAYMCKHVAAVLYGIGARLDQEPNLLFTLRGVDAQDLVNQAGAGLTQNTQAPTSANILDDASLADVFGIELLDMAPAKKPVVKKAAKKEVTKKTVKAVAVVKPASKKAAAPKAAIAVKKAVVKASAAPTVLAAVVKAKTKPASKPAAKPASKAKPAAKAAAYSTSVEKTKTLVRKKAVS